VLIALGIQQAMRVGHIVICGLSGSTLFFHVIPQTAQFSKNFTEHKVWFSSSSQISSATFLILRRTERDMIKKVFVVHVRHPLFLSDSTEY
jgi:hypothetical protein